MVKRYDTTLIFAFHDIDEGKGVSPGVLVSHDDGSMASVSLTDMLRVCGVVGDCDDLLGRTSCVLRPVTIPEYEYSCFPYT